MLRHLQIRDFAIIESVELDFSAGLTVLGNGANGIEVLIALETRRSRVSPEPAPTF